ncbi:MAG: DNA-directed RNA polymerase subunit omega [Candidatus Aminicenantes bacterium]|nr:DNA-directed RNA polymerase subunit omega [Candidatus Aminicenantes bacterium]
MKTSTEIENKFRFVILAAKRAKQLLRGDKPRLKSKSKNPIRIAQLEVVEGLVHYDLVEPKKEQVRKPEEEGFIGEEIRDRGELVSKEDEVKAEKKEKEPKEKPKEKLKAEAKKKPKEKPKEKPKKRPVEKPKMKHKEKPKAKSKETLRKKAKEIPKKKT